MNLDFAATVGGVTIGSDELRLGVETLVLDDP